MTDTRPGIDWEVDYIAGAGEGMCETCCRDVLSVGRISGEREEESGRRHSFLVCDECLPLLFAGDWAGIEQMVFDYQSSEWTWWEAVVHRRHARKVARRIAAMNRGLFTYLSDPTLTRPDRPHAA